MDVKCKFEIKDEPIDDAEDDANNEQDLKFEESRFGDFKREIEVNDGLVVFNEDPKDDEEFSEFEESLRNMKSDDVISHEKNLIFVKEEVESKGETLDDKPCENNCEAKQFENNSSDILPKNYSQNGEKNIQTETNKKLVWKCSDCSYESDRKRNWKRHVLRQSCTRFFKCSECDYDCKRKVNLMNHMLRHSNVKIYKCSECSFNCKYKKDLLKHEKTHLAPKLFKCSECNYEINHKVLLKYHIQKHAEVKIFKCSECSYECNMEEQLDKHMIKHSIVKLKCSECDYECIKEGYLKRHISKHRFKDAAKSLRTLAPASSNVSAPTPTFLMLIPGSSSSSSIDTGVNMKNRISTTTRKLLHEQYLQKIGVCPDIRKEIRGE